MATGSRDELARRCDLLRSLHVPGRPLVLPNAWDAASARIVAEAGFPVVATTSGGVASALGFEDHEAAPAAEMFAAATRIANAVDVPVTVDAEAGYGMAPDDLVEALITAGAAGCNLEDSDHIAGSLTDPTTNADRLAAIRRAASERGYGLAINARIDVFLADRARPQPELLDEAIARATAYRAAGVDCVYPIFLSDEPTIGAFVKAMECPVNILATQRAPSFERLAELGVARVSYGSSLHNHVMGELTTHLASLPRPAGG
jgi:2-methylisocitrate lyase-like PEP mutase family enzyme